jgi:hypothetical protein
MQAISRLAIQLSNAGKQFEGHINAYPLIDIRQITQTPWDSSGGTEEKGHKRKRE